MNHWKISTIVLGTVLAGSFAVATVREAQAEAQPMMKAALTQLRLAEQSLAKATPDKGGHRVKAMELTKQAIEQVQKGIDFDNKH